MADLVHSNNILAMTEPKGSCEAFSSVTGTPHEQTAVIKGSHSLGVVSTAFRSRFIVFHHRWPGGVLAWAPAIHSKLKKLNLMQITMPAVDGLKLPR